MGISAIFRLNRAPGPSGGGSSSDQTKARFIARRQPAAPSTDAAPVPSAGESRKGRGKAPAGRAPRSWGRAAPAAASLASSDDGLPTPDDSSSGSGLREHRPRGKGAIQAPARQESKPTRGGRDGRDPGALASSDVFGLGRLRIPLLAAQVPPLKELDPFEDSPPRRPLTDFEDPTYIPPLTLTATLFDDYGLVAGALGSTTPPATPAHAEKPKASRASTVRPRAAVGGAAAAPAKPAASTAGATSGPLDLLGEFTTTYNYLFGAPPSDSAIATFADTRPAPRVADFGLLSPASTLPSKTSIPADDDGDGRSLASSEDAHSDEAGSSSGSSTGSADRRALEERRKEDERKAAELRNRRRQVLKQQVAFERMKERHRRQCPGQPAGPHGGIARWQKEAAGAAGPAHGQGALPGAARSLFHANCATIGSGELQAPHPPPVLSQSHVALHPGRHAATFPSAVRTSASLVAMPGHADGQPPHAWQMKVLPPLADPAAARPPAGPGPSGAFAHASPAPLPLLPVGVPYPAAAAIHPLMAYPASAQPSLLPAISAHPVRLASTPGEAKNAYLSDSSGDDASDSTSLCDSEGLSGSSSSEALAAPAGSAHHRTSTQLAGSQASTNDSSGEESGKSQSSSKRRVRFHETVAVVFNTRQPASDDEDGSDGAGEPGDSDNDSSSVSVDLAARHGSRDMCAASTPLPKRLLPVGRGGCVADDAFDDAGAPGHLRYRIPPNSAPKDAARAHPEMQHRIETQPLRDHEAERKQCQRNGVAVSESAANDRHTHEPDALARPQQGARHAGNDARGPLAGGADGGASHPDQAADPVTEARRALLGHYSVPHPMRPIGNCIPRSGGMAPTYPRGSSVKVIGPQSFARPKGYIAPDGPQQPKCTLPAPKHRLHRRSPPLSQEPGGDGKCDQARGPPQPLAPPVAQNLATARNAPHHPPTSGSSTSSVRRTGSNGHGLGDVLSSRSLAGPGTGAGITGGAGAQGDGGGKPTVDPRMPSGGSLPLNATRRSSGSDGDDIPLSAMVRSTSEPLPGQARRAADAQTGHPLTSSPDTPPEHSVGHTATDAGPMQLHRLFGRPPKELRKQVLVRTTGRGPVKSGTLAEAMGARSVSMDSARLDSADLASAPGKRRFHRWGSIF